MANLITPDELPLWLPGEITVDSVERNWTGMRLRGFRYAAADAIVPPLNCFCVMLYKHGRVRIQRHCACGWLDEHAEPGAISVLTHAVPSHWRWSQMIEVTHLYIAPEAVCHLARDIYQHDIEVLSLRDVLCAEDPVLARIVAELEAEARMAGLGERLYADGLRIQASIHLLRRYANVTLREHAAPGRFTHAQQQQILDYVRETLDRSIKLGDLAAVVDLSLFHFARKFRATFGQPPHLWVMTQRIESAKVLLARWDAPLNVVAMETGFADQSHMTRIFRRMVGVTPGEYRRNVARALPL